MASDDSVLEERLESYAAPHPLSPLEVNADARIIINYARGRDSFGVEAGVVSLKLGGTMILLWVLSLGLLRREGCGIYNEESYHLMVFPRRVR
jgi:hypothetical protein